MEPKRQRLLLNRIRRSKALLGATLILSILASSFSLATLASGPTCHLACCAGRAPHATGSCMNDSCHTFLSRSKTTHTHYRFPVQRPEQFCGIRRGKQFTATLLGKSTTVNFLAYSKRSPGRRAPGEASLSTKALGKPCEQDCGAGTLASSRQSRPRESVTSDADRPRPPSITRHRPSLSNLAKASDAVTRQLRLRGPPTSSS